jgi:hypothetical protein
MVVLCSNIFALQRIVHLILVISIIKICSHLRDLVVCLGLATLDISIRIIHIIVRRFTHWILPFRARVLIAQRRVRAQTYITVLRTQVFA